MHSYESIKSSVRLLLKSSPHGLTLNQLNADFQQYYPMENIPYERFGYSTLLNFLRDMSDTVQINEISTPLTVSARSTSNSNALKPIQLGPIRISRNFGLENQENLQIKVFHQKHSSLNDKKMKPVKRLVLRTLSTNTDRSNHRHRSSNDHLVSSFNRLNIHKNSAEDFYSYNLFNINIDPKTPCQIVRYSDGKFYIACHELAELLRVREEELDRETMFSRVRLYPSSDLYNKLDKEHPYGCRHRRNKRQPYRFLFLLSSVLSLLKTKAYLNRYSHLILPLEKLFK